MLYHRELRVPMLAHLPVHHNVTDATLRDIVETTRLTDQFVKESTEESFARAEKFYNKRTVTSNYKVGDIALLYDEHIMPGLSKKLHRFYRPSQL